MTKQLLFFRIFVVGIAAAGLFYTAQGISQQSQGPTLTAVRTG